MTCRHPKESEDSGWHSHIFLFARERQGSTLCPVEFEQLSLMKITRDYRGKTGSVSEVVKGRPRYSSLQNTGKNTISGMTLILATKKPKERTGSKDLDRAEEFAVNIIHICWPASASGHKL